ncbi:MAG: ATP-binding protein [Saprospiraceae bacterium]
MALNYSESNRDSSIFYANLALSIAEKLDQNFYQASILSDLGYTLLSSGDYGNALTNLLKANKWVEDINVANHIIVTPFYKKYFTSADPKINRVILIGYIKNSLAMLYGRTDNLNQQLSELQEAKKIIESETSDLNLRYTINNNIANAYLNMGQLDSALYFQNIVLEIESKIENKNYSGASNKAIGDIYFRKENFEKAKRNYLLGLHLLEKSQNVFYIALSQFALADTYRKLGKFDSSLYYSKAGIANYRTLGSSVPEMEESYTALALSFSDERKYDSAYQYLQLAKNLSDSLTHKEIRTLTAFQNIGFKEQMRLKEEEAERVNGKNRAKILLLLAGLALFSIIAYILYQSNKMKVAANLLLAEQKKQIENTLVELKSTQSQLIQSEKMASLGELTAGIAHEIQNPLNFVNNFSGLNTELIDEIKDERKKVVKDENLIEDLLNDLKDNSTKINTHGQRASNIVKGMLEHSRKSSGEKSHTDINVLCEEYAKLSYQAMRAKDPKFNAEYTLELDPDMPKVNVIAQDMSRVLLNLLNNAFYAVNVKNVELLNRGIVELNSEMSKVSAESYEPMVVISTHYVASSRRCEIKVSDNGFGIPDNIKDKIFQPFFTTKPTGQGTGLGLSLSYDIVKAQGGTIIINNTSEGSIFQILLPIQ